MRVLQIRTVKPGDPLTADLWNETAGIINAGLRPPRDLETNVEAQLSQRRVLAETIGTRVTTEERVENPDDSDQYVNTNRTQSFEMWDQETARFWTFEMYPPAAT